MECGFVGIERGNSREDSEFGGSVITQTFAPSVHVKASGVFNEYSCHRLNVITTLKKG